MGGGNGLLRAFFLGVLLILFACTPKVEERRKGYAKEFFSEALADYREGDYGDAKVNFEKALSYIEHLSPQEIKKAKYLLVKSAYLDKDYVNAVVYAEDFLSNYPGSKEAEEVFFILVDSLVKVAPDPYRDQTYTLQAIEKAKEFLKNYPNSKYSPKVLQVIEEARKKIAEHELLIAKFYEDYGFPYNAAVRYREIMVNFPDVFPEERLAYLYIKNLFKTPLQVRREKEKIKDLLEKAREKLEEVKSEEEKKAVRNRIKFLKSEIERWEKIGEESLKEAEEALKNYREVYGENRYYRELIKLKEKWKSSSL